MLAYRCPTMLWFFTVSDNILNESPIQRLQDEEEREGRCSGSSQGERRDDKYRLCRKDVLGKRHLRVMVPEPHHHLHHENHCAPPPSRPSTASASEAPEALRFSFFLLTPSTQRGPAIIPGSISSTFSIIFLFLPLLRGSVGF